MSRDPYRDRWQAEGVQGGGHIEIRHHGSLDLVVAVEPGNEARAQVFAFPLEFCDGVQLAKRPLTDKGDSGLSKPLRDPQVRYCVPDIIVVPSQHSDVAFRIGGRRYAENYIHPRDGTVLHINEAVGLPAEEFATHTLNTRAGLPDFRVDS